MCSKEKSSSEHAPARCFFPKDKRINLITVDSCAEHNEDTSKDDLYVKNIITMIGGNSTAYQHFQHKTMESFKESPRLFASTTEKQYQVIVNEAVETAIEVEKDRIDLVMRKIAYAIFYYKYNKIWFRKLITIMPSLKVKGLKSFNSDEFGQLIEKFQGDHIPIYEGSNPTVFQYAFIKMNDDINNNFLRMKFYEGCEVWIIPDEDAGHSEPEFKTIY
jgi:hypothetical protein